MFEKNFITSGELRELRINGCRIQLGGDFIIDDRLESEGSIRISEYIGGCLYLEPEHLFLENAPVVAGISISRSGDSLMLEKVSCGHGHEGLIPLLAGQVRHFAEFYGYGVDFPDLLRRQSNYGYESRGQCKRQHFI